MKKALSYKILLVIMALAFSLALVFSFSGAKLVRAHDDITSPSNAFSGGQEISFDDNKVKAIVKSGDTVKITNQLVVDDLEISLSIPDEVENYKITLSYTSLAESVFGDVNKTFAGLTEKGDVTFYITTDENKVLVKVNDELVESQDDPDNDKPKYEISGVDKHVAKIKFEFTLTGGAESANVYFNYIDQKASDDSSAYKQTFELEEGKIKTLAKPRISLNNLPVISKNGVLQVEKGVRYTFSLNSFKVYSVFDGDPIGTGLYIDKDKVGSAWVDPYSETPKSIAFKDNSDTLTICTSEKEDVETYPINIYTSEEDSSAPDYVDGDIYSELYDDYKELVKKAAQEDGHSIRLGSTFEIPSLENLVRDDYNLYSDLEATVYYKTPSTSSSTSAMSFVVGEAGDYEFFVVFADKCGNTMKKEEFYELEDDGLTIKQQDYRHGFAVFTFSIVDDAPMSVEAPASQGEGYLNTKYIATHFTIESSGYNVRYALYYNEDVKATADSEGWIELPLISAIDEEYDEEGFTYEDISAIAYDGEYTFTPIKLGAYKIDCKVTSDMSERFASGSTVIKVEKEPTEVKVDTHWFKNNLWSIIFLSVGTLALIGIIVLLFIKPKEEVVTDETGDALKAKENQ